MVFVPDKDGLRELETEADFMEFAEAIAEEAKRIAPRDDEDYANSIKAVKVEQSIFSELTGQTGGFYVASDVFYAWMLEYGTVDTPTFATLRTAAKNLGLDVDDAHHD